MTEPDLSIGRSGADHLAFWVIRREHPGATDYWDGNWLETRIELAAGGVRAGVTADLRADEFQSFREALERADSRRSDEALLEPVEPWLHVRIAVGTTGALAVTGDFYDELGTGNRVEFALKTDLALGDLSSMIRALRAIEQRFPVLGSRTEP